MYYSIKNKLQSYKGTFLEDINYLSNNAVKGSINNQDIKNFSTKWKNSNIEIQESIKNDVIEFFNEIQEKSIIKSTIKSIEFEEQPFFNNEHNISPKVVAFVLEGVTGGISIALAANIVPIIGSAISAGIFIHLTIMGIKYKINKNKQKNKLMQSIINYSGGFIDNLNVYENEIIGIIQSTRDRLIQQIDDDYLARSLNFNEEKGKKLKTIIDSFETMLDENFIFKNE